MFLSRDLPRDQFVTKKIRVLTYSTFVSSTGPGGEIFNRFKKDFNGDVEVTTASDAGLLLERLKLASAAEPFDVVIGLDQNLVLQAKTDFQWKPLPTQNTPFALQPFAAFDWSPMTFIYREGDEPPRDFADLLSPKYKGMFALQDPRASSPGLQFFSWVKDVEGAKTSQFLTAFKPNVQSVSPSWAFSYGLFKKKQAHFVFSYLTSLAFHWGSEKDRSYRAVSLPEGHPVQAEYAGIPANCGECELAGKLVSLLLSDDGQKIIMQKNFMLPVRDEVKAGTIFAELPGLKLRPFKPLAKDLNDWDQVFKH
jgi:thiamine transport system substrate-binding protein